MRPRAPAAAHARQADLVSSCTDRATEQPCFPPYRSASRRCGGRPCSRLSCVGSPPSIASEGKAGARVGARKTWCRTAIAPQAHFARRAAPKGAAWLSAAAQFGELLCLHDPMRRLPERGRPARLTIRAPGPERASLWRGLRDSAVRSRPGRARRQSDARPSAAGRGLSSDATARRRGHRFR
jgi:hypothetical protein